MNISNNNQTSKKQDELASEIYNNSINKPTVSQHFYVDQLKKLYIESHSDKVADYYAMSLFNLSLRVASKEMQQIYEELEKLFHNNPTKCIAAQRCRLKFNITLKLECNTSMLKQCATEFESLYHQYPSDSLAEPLAKIWYSLVISRALDRLDYVQKIVELCSHITDPETNTVYAKILFDSKIPINNRDNLIDEFLSNPQELESFQTYVESPYFPHHNKALLNFKISSTYPTNVITARVNHDLSKIKKRSNYIELKVEILSLLYHSLKIKRLLIVPETKEFFGHYTKVENLKHLIVPGTESGKLRMSNAGYMNDPSEGKTLFDYLSDSENSGDSNSLIDNPSNIYISCFTSSIDELSMWSMYGNDGKGCCLLLNGDFFDYTNEDITSDFLLSNNQVFESNYLYRVCYLSYTSNDITIVHEEFDEDFTKNLSNEISDSIIALKSHYKRIALLRNKNDKTVDKIVALILDQIRYLFKDQSYAYERELRLIKYSESPLLDNDSWIVPQLYVEVEKPLEYEQVILGPKVEQVNRIIPYLIYTGKVKKVKKSKIKYR